ncbi:MAG: sigma-E processing peptidase SpoIIGA [Clostridiaceae bacterium]|nr:sigma-E processing peptidase SpoIIGA [Clostridiaceae bacterium]
MEIYLDVLVLENIVMNYLILWTTSKILKMKTSNLRLFAGALIGALYAAFLILKPELKLYYTATATFILSLVMVAVTFSPEKLVSFVKTLIVFYVSTFIFAGAAFAFFYLNSQGTMIKNGLLYVFWDSKWTAVVLSIITSIIIIKVFIEVIQQKFFKEKLITHIKVIFDKKEINISALIDTGNSLQDPISNMPVIIVEFSAIKEILPSEICSIFEQVKEQDFSSLTSMLYSSEWFNRFRLIPFNSLGKENGMLIGFKPDYVVIGDDVERKSIRDVVIAIYNKVLSRTKNYRALLGPDLL